MHLVSTKHYSEIMVCPDIRFHDLRHTYASMLLSEELSVKAVSNTLGHAKSIVTVDVYGDKARIIGDGTDAMRPTLEYGSSY